MFSSLHPTKKYFLVMFVISCLLLEVFALVTYYQSEANKKSTERVIQSYKVLAAGRLILTDAVYLTDQEQDYALTRAATYLTAYEGTLSDLGKNLDALAKATADNDQHQKNTAALLESGERLKQISLEHFHDLQERQTGVDWLKTNAAATQQALTQVHSAYEVFNENESQDLISNARVRDIKHNNYIWTLIMGGALGLGGLIIANLAIFSLIARNTRTEEELAKATKKAEAANQSKSDFLATISHEIRTPMNVVIGLARLLLKTPLKEKQQEMVETLGANADILLRLVNDLLDISRIEAGQIELESRPFTFGGILKALNSLFSGQATAKGLSLSITNKTGKHSFIGDPLRIQQILVNLLSNAFRFTSRGGITVTAEIESQTDDKAQVRITVIDTGIGIPVEKLPLIFGKFVQADQTIARKFGGSGLGLSISLAIAQLMGGDITAASSPNKGSTFTVTLPLKKGAKKKLKPSAVDESMPPAPTFEGNILLVEDYQPNVMVATMMLENLGFTVDVAGSGAEVIEKIHAKETPYTAILMDVQVQDMDGFEIVRRIRKLEKEKGFRHFIIAVTAHALAGDRERCIAAGMDDYISKPINPSILEKKMGQLTSDGPKNIASTRITPSTA